MKERRYSILHLCQLLQQRLRLLQIARIEPLRKDSQATKGPMTAGIRLTPRARSSHRCRQRPCAARQRHSARTGWTRKLACNRSPSREACAETRFEEPRISTDDADLRVIAGPIAGLASTGLTANTGAPHVQS